MYLAVSIDPETHVKPDDREQVDNGEGEHDEEEGHVGEMDAEQIIPDERNHGEEQIVFVHDENYNQLEIFEYEIVQDEHIEEVDSFVNDKDEDTGLAVPMTQVESNQDKNPEEEEDIPKDVGYEDERDVDEHNYSTNTEQITGDRLEENVTNLMYLAGELAKHDESVKEVDNSNENYDDSDKKKRYI